ncbi:SUKH-4 family immunity protein [Streptomyces sp. NPDC003036]|uniref:SUKH-4 family immunity protein n=1 Tax=Streptomyces sp. NPDC003036 TaxID=3154442 RepID=UPI0033B8D633
MVTFAQAQERAEEWVNGDVPAYQHREVRVREFELGFVVWAEDREEGPTSDGGRQRLVIARDSGEATLWPGLPVGEVIRRYEEEYGAPPADAAPVAAPAPERIDLNQTSFLLTPPEWLQDAADKRGIPRREASEPAAVAEAAEPAVAAPDVLVAGGGSASAGEDVWAAPVGARGRGGVDYEPTASDGVPAGSAGAAGSAGPSWNDTSGGNGSGDDGSVPLPATVFAPPLTGADDDGTPPPAVGADAPTALLPGGSQLPRTAIAPALDPQAMPGAAAPGAPGPAAGDIADAATSKAVLPPRAARPSRGAGPTTPPPPGAPGTPGARPSATGPGAPGAPAGGYVPTQLVAQLGPEGPQPPAPPAPPGPPGATPPPGGGVHHAATMLAQPGPAGPPPPAPPGPVGGDAHHAATMLAHPGPGGIGGAGGTGGPQPPAPPGPPGAPGAPRPPGATPPPGGGVHHAATMLAQPGPGGPQPPAPPAPAPAAPAFPQPQPPMGRPMGPPPGQPTGQPTVGPGYQAVLRYRAPDGSEQQLIRRSAPGTPHPEWQMFHELRAMNIPPDQVLELHTELESCDLPGGYCARMIRETWPQARITSIASYGRDHVSRQQGMAQLIAHHGELHQVADGPARPAPLRAPLPPVQPAPPVPPEAIAQELVAAFGPQGICRFDQRAVSRQGVPELVALTLVWAGLPADFGPFFWAQPAQPVVPTLAELAAQRQVQPASDAGSYLVLGSDFGRALCVQYGTAHIVAVPVEAGPGGQPVAPQFVNSGLPEFTRCLALLGRMWRLRFGLTPEQAGRWTVDFQAQLAMLDPAALASPESWWSVLLEQMWDGLL